MFPYMKVAAACLVVAAGSAVPGLAGVASAQTQTGNLVRYSYKTVTINGKARSELNGINA
jgi:hypothetical protein